MNGNRTTGRIFDSGQQQQKEDKIMCGQQSFWSSLVNCQEGNLRQTAGRFMGCYRADLRVFTGCNSKLYQVVEVSKGPHRAAKS